MIREDADPNRVSAFYLDGETLCPDCASDVRDINALSPGQMQRVMVPVGTRECDYCHERIA